MVTLKLCPSRPIQVRDLSLRERGVAAVGRERVLWSFPGVRLNLRVPSFPSVMDNQHRHELQQNDLALGLQKLNRFLEKYGNRISIGICVATALLVGWILWRNAARGRDQVAWSQLSAASSPDDLADVWKKNPDSAAAPWARLVEAEQRLASGIQSMFLDVEAGRKDVDLARKSFEVLSEQSSAAREVRERALFGLARAEESMSDGSTKEATAAYQRLLERFPDSFYKDEAQRRLKELASGGSAEFYQWFAKFDRPKAKDQTPRDTGLRDSSDPLLDELRRKAQEIGEEKANEAQESGDDSDEGLSVPGETAAPATEVPSEPAAETPAEPAAENPAEPAAENPTEPAPATPETPPSE